MWHTISASLQTSWGKLPCVIESQKAWPLGAATVPLRGLKLQEQMHAPPPGSAYSSMTILRYEGKLRSASCTIVSCQRQAAECSVVGHFPSMSNTLGWNQSTKINKWINKFWTKETLRSTEPQNSMPFFSGTEGEKESWKLKPSPNTVIWAPEKKVPGTITHFHRHQSWASPLAQARHLHNPRVGQESLLTQTEVGTVYCQPWLYDTVVRWRLRD